MLYNYIIRLEEQLINQQSYLQCRTVYKMNKQPEITEQTRKNIIAAFCRLYEEKPIEKISVKEVIALAGYNRSTFYEYFTDIYALLEFIEDDVIDYIKVGLNNRTKSQTDLLTLLAAKEDYLKVLMGTYGCIHFQDRLKNEFMQVSEPNEYGEIRAYLEEFHMTVSLSMYRLWLKQGKDISLDELSGLIHTLYTEGVQGVVKSV